MVVIWRKCCRIWPLSAGAPWGRCPDCGTKPTELVNADELEPAGYRITRG